MPELSASCTGAETKINSLQLHNGYPEVVIFYQIAASIYTLCDKQVNII
jgi:hypothetical protein